MFKNFIRAVEGYIDAITASSLLMHAIMIVAAVASYGNIKDYLVGGHSNAITAHAMACVLGASLVVSSSRLTKLNVSRLKHDQWMQVVVVIACLTAFVSGIIQTAEYVKNGYGYVSGSALGFGIPVLLEVGPALAVAFIKRIEENERTDKLKHNMAEKINESISIALDEIKPDDIRKEVELAAQLFTREFVDSVTGEMLHQLREANSYRLSHFTNETQAAQPEPKVKARKQLVAQPEPTINEVVQVVEDADTQAQADPESATTGNELDELDGKIIAAIKDGATTPYAISKQLEIAQTTLKRKKADGTYIGRLPTLVESGYLLNGGSTYTLRKE